MLPEMNIDIATNQNAVSYCATEMRSDTQSQRADSITQVAPEAVDPDGRAAPVRYEKYRRWRQTG